MRNLKKLLAVVVVICILATMAIPAFAAGSFTYETQAKSLYDMKLFLGNSATDYVPALDGSLTREQGIALLVRLFGKDADAKALTGAADVLAAYTDAAKVSAWAKNYVAYAVKTGMVKGETATTINPQGKLIGNAFATMILRNLGYADGVYADASATLQTKGGSLTADAAKAFGNKELIRDDACGIMFSALLAKDTAGKTAVENLIAAGVVTEAQASAAGLVATATAKVTDTNKVTVTFTSAVDPAKVKVTLKQGLAIQYTTAAFAADNKSVVLTAPVAIIAGDYNVVITGLKATEVSLPITVGAVTAKAIDITNTQVAINDGVVTFTVTNQYGTDMGITGASIAAACQAFDVTTGYSVDVTAGTDSTLKLNLSNADKYKIGDDIRIIANYNELTVVKTVKVIAKASSATITLGTVAPLTGKTRISINESGLAIPYTLKDQYGNDATLSLTDGSITFLSSNTNIINPANNFTVDTTNKKIIFKTGATSGTVVITAVINASGSVAKTTIVVSATPAIASIAIASPTTILAVNDTAKLALTGVDQYGGAVTSFTGVSIKFSDNTIATAQILSGKLNITGVKAGTVTVTLYSGDTTYGAITVKFEAVAKPIAITGIDAATTLEAGATQTIAYSDIAVKDQYGRDYTLSAGELTVTETDGNAIVDVDTTVAGKVTIKAKADAGSEAIKFALVNNGASYSTTYNVVASSSIVSYAVTGAKTIYADTTTGTAYDLQLGVEGKLADGTKVVLAAGKVTNATSSNLAVATVSNTGLVNGLTKGTTTITLWNGADQLATATITVDDAAPVATTAAFEATDYSVTATKDLRSELTVSDQYGVALAKVGFWASTDSSVATVDQTGTVTAVANGTCTIKFVTTNGIVATASVTVEK